MLKFGKTLVIAAHPDDETLGCGGLISRLTHSGNEVKVIFMAEGPSCRYENGPSQEMGKEIEYRNECAIKALKILGVNKYFFHNLPCGRLDMQPIIKLAKILEKEISIFRPTSIITHSRKDVNKDHKITYQAALQATRPTGNSVEQLLSFEILSSSEWNYPNQFNPNVFIDIEEHFVNKIKAMNCYSTEQPPAPHPRSDKVIKSLARYRGSQAGLNYAESFELIRLFIK